MRFVDWFHHYRNKIFAVSLSGLALTMFLVYHIVTWATFGFDDFLSFGLSFWNFLVVFTAFIIIFICNLNNDAAVYAGILMFLFTMVFSQILSLWNPTVNLILSATSFSPEAILFYSLELALLGAQIVFGILLYIDIARYRMGRWLPFKRMRLFAILFTVSLALTLGFDFAFLFFSGASTAEGGWLLFLEMVPIAKVLMATAVVFTLERLRRD